MGSLSLKGRQCLGFPLPEIHAAARNAPPKKQHRVLTIDVIVPSPAAFAHRSPLIPFGGGCFQKYFFSIHPCNQNLQFPPSWV